MKLSLVFCTEQYCYAPTLPLSQVILIIFFIVWRTRGEIKGPSHITLNICSAGKQILKQTLECKLSLLYFLTQIHFPIRGGCGTCHWLKRTKSLAKANKTYQLPRETTTWSFDSHKISLCSLELWQICVPAGIKQTIFLQFFSFSWVGRYNKTLNDCSCRKQSVLFPLDLYVHVGITRGNIEDLRETKFTVFLGLRCYV